MTTLIAAYNSEGCIGQCDAKCHNATQPRCTCICGGVNHGVGLARAQANMLAFAPEKVKEWIKGVDPEGKGHRVLTQIPLFALE